MLPEFEILGIPYSTYGFFTAIGIVLMTVVALKLSEKKNISYFDILVGELLALIGAFLGAHLLYAITNVHGIATDISLWAENKGNIENLIYILYKYFSGMVFYGGLIFGLITGFIYCKIRKIDINSFSDCFGVVIPLFHCFGRIGCFFSGCCYGIESTLGFTSTKSLIASCNYVNRFPVQLLEASLNLVLFIILITFFFNGIFSNNLIYIYLNLYSIIRFFDEFLRGDTYRGIWLGMSTSQWISIFLFIFSSVMLIIRLKPAKNKIYIK